MMTINDKNRNTFHGYSKWQRVKNMENETKIGLWKKTSKAGVVYYSGSTGTHWVTIFLNKNKTKDTSPDLNMIMKPKDSSCKQPENKQQQNQSETHSEYDDIPF